MDDLKPFLLSINIQINAHDKNEAQTILANKATLEAIVKAILDSSENIQEAKDESAIKLLN